ncbi:EP300-interacting inhibitor of differentiation 2-like [Pseudopipra pipra]|uniref:EP300-interacting inhibitor of differentiation 2-like n=1 Tax=Pseudopipra pipra TaxID=415032 RepID=UPI0031396B35
MSRTAGREGAERDGKGQGREGGAVPSQLRSLTPCPAATSPLRAYRTGHGRAAGSRNAASSRAQGAASRELPGPASPRQAGAAGEPGGMLRAGCCGRDAAGGMLRAGCCGRDAAGGWDAAGSRPATASESSAAAASRPARAAWIGRVTLLVQWAVRAGATPRAAAGAGRARRQEETWVRPRAASSRQSTSWE